MKTAQAVTDKLAISLSLLCAIHCLALPLLLIWLPSLALLNLDNEAFHLWMVIAVIPSSIYALTVGCKQHKRFPILLLGILGLAILISALFFGEQFGESGETILTLLGAAIVSSSHWFNFRLCRDPKNSDNCHCPDHQQDANP